MKLPLFQTITSRIATAAFVSGIAVLAAAQTKIIHPFERVIGPSAIIESSLSVFPQISQSYSTKPMKPANPGRQVGIGPSNNLVAGSLLTDTRGQKEMNFPGITATGWDPPDPSIGVGPNHVVQVVNTSIAWFNKTTGQKQFEQTMGPNGFFASVNPSSFVFDPKAFYDQISKRFFVVALDVDFNNETSNFLIAVSDDSDPNGNWFKYKFDNEQTANNTAYWLDYPGWGYNKDVIVATGNMFGYANGGNGTQHFVFTKAPMLTGAAPTITKFSTPELFTVQPCNTMDNNAVVFGVETNSTSEVTIVAYKDLLTTPTMATTTVGIPQFSNANPQIPSKGGATLGPPAVRMLNSFARGGKVYATHGVSVSGADRRGKVRWYEFNMGTWPTSGQPTLVQSGDIIGPSGISFSNPDIAVNAQFDVSIVFTRSSQNIAADVMFAGRKRTDPLGTMGAPVQLASSPGNYSGGNHRWGDYAGCRIDPSDDNTFWGCNQTIRVGGNWGTEINKWTISDIGGGGGGGASIKPSIISVYQGTYLSGNLASVLNSDNSFYEIQSVLQPNVGQVATTEMTFPLAQTGDQLSSLYFEVEPITTPSVSATGSIWIYNWTSGVYIYLKSFTIPGSGDAKHSVTVNLGLANYVNSSKECRFVVRGLTPLRRGGANPLPFILKVDTAGVVPSSAN